MLCHIFGDRGLPDIDAELEKLSVDARSAPTNNKRSTLLNAGLLRDLRFSTLIWWRRTRISASRRAVDRKTQ